MKVISVVFLCFFVLACSSTKVHLYTRYLSAQEAEVITKKLEANDFDVIPNTLVFPDDIQQSTLLYSPFVQGENRINILIETLSDIGWVIPYLQPLFAGNHYYTKNSVGLLLLPDGVGLSDKVAKQDLVNEYESKACDTAMKLRLKSDGTYQITHSNNAYSNNTDQQNEKLKGSWHITSYPYIELISLDEVWRFYFEIQKKTVTDVVGKIEVIELKPVDELGVIPNCNFLYGLRI